MKRTSRKKWQPTYTNKYATSAHRHLNAAHAAIEHINARRGLVYPETEIKAKAAILEAIERARMYMGQLTLRMHVERNPRRKRTSRGRR